MPWEIGVKHLTEFLMERLDHFEENRSCVVDLQPAIDAVDKTKLFVTEMSAPSQEEQLQ